MDGFQISEISENQIKLRISEGIYPSDLTVPKFVEVDGIKRRVYGVSVHKDAVLNRLYVPDGLHALNMRNNNHIKELHFLADDHTIHHIWVWHCKNLEKITMPDSLVWNEISLLLWYCSNLKFIYESTLKSG